LKRHGLKILSYYVVDNEPLVMEFSIDRSNVFDMQLLESSFDLMQNPLFSMQKRRLDDANSVYLERCRGYQATIKPTPPIVLEQ
jgi:hypothetical protein